MWYITLFCGKVYVAERDDLLPCAPRIKIRSIQASAAVRQFLRHNVPHDYVRLLEQDLQSDFDTKQYKKEFQKKKRKAMHIPFIEVKEGQELDRMAQQSRRMRMSSLMKIIKAAEKEPLPPGSIFANCRAKHA